jgi:hypothetical protein
MSRIKRFSPTPRLGSRGGFETTVQKWFQKLPSGPRSRRGKYVQPEAYIEYVED